MSEAVIVCMTFVFAMAAILLSAWSAMKVHRQEKVNSAVLSATKEAVRIVASVKPEAISVMRNIDAVDPELAPRTIKRMDREPVDIIFTEKDLEWSQWAVSNPDEVEDKDDLSRARRIVEQSKRNRETYHA